MADLVDCRPLTADCDCLGLYIHVPFCSAICNYCNFNRGLFDAAAESAVRRTPFSRRSRRRAGLTGRSRLARPAPTPSISAAARRRCSNPSRSRAIIAACREAFAVAPDAEVTLEANPESVDEARLAAFRHAGVNRLSFGVQSFREEELRRLSRLHTVERATLAVGEARRAGFDNLSLDLMMWLPEQRVDQWLRSIDAAIALGPEHLSLYLLEVYPNAPLREDMARARWSQAPDDDAASMYMEAMERLESAGLEQYRDLERREARPAIAPQSQVLDRRRVARVRVRGPHDEGRRQDEECLRHRRVHRVHRRAAARRRSKSAGCPATNASATPSSRACVLQRA